MIQPDNNYAKTSSNLWLSQKNDPNDILIDFELSQYKARIIGRTPANGNTKDSCTSKILE